MSEKTWADAWRERYEETPERPRRRIFARLRRGGGSRTGRYAVLAAVGMAVVAAPFAVAAGKGRFEASDSRYTVLARNTANGDGGAMATACTSNASTPGHAHEPCLNMVNKGTGFAAAFRTRGLQGFRLQTSGNGTATPFILDKNATGKVTYFNADQLDGKDSTEVGREPWALIDGGATPAVIRQSGGVTITRTGVGDYRVGFAQDVNQCSYQATSASLGTNRTVTAREDTTNTKQVTVQLRRAANTEDPVDGDFSIAVHC
jgi:hypothetical protein